MSAHVLLNLLNEVKNSYKIRGLHCIASKSKTPNSLLSTGSTRKKSRHDAGCPN